MVDGKTENYNTIIIKLADINVLLGDGIIREISVHHNLDVSFEAIMDIIASKVNL